MMTFKDRLAATGLKPLDADLAALEALVTDLDRAAVEIRSPRPYHEEPLSALRLSQP